MLQLLLSPVNKNGNHYHSVSAFKQNAVHTMLMLAASRICGNTWKWEMAQFLPLDQINGAVKMSKRYKYLWCACQFSCLAQGPRLLIENFDFYLRLSLRTWGRGFPRLLWAWTPATFIGNKGKYWTEKSLAVLFPCLPFFFWQLEILATAMPSVWLSLLANFSCQLQQFGYNAQH